jgi:hypothetical protein
LNSVVSDISITNDSHLSRFLVALPSDNAGFCLLFNSKFELLNNEMEEIDYIVQEEEHFQRKDQVKNKKVNSNRYQSKNEKPIVGARGDLLFENDFEISQVIVGSIRYCD